MLHHVYMDTSWAHRYQVLIQNLKHLHFFISRLISPPNISMKGNITCAMSRARDAIKENKTFFWHHKLQLSDLHDFKCGLAAPVKCLIYSLIARHLLHSARQREAIWHCGFSSYQGHREEVNICGWIMPNNKQTIGIEATYCCYFSQWYAQGASPGIHANKRKMQEN